MGPEPLYLALSAASIDCGSGLQMRIFHELLLDLGNNILPSTDILVYLFRVLVFSVPG